MAALVPASQALLLKDSFDFVYEAQVEHRFLPWAKQKVAKEIVDKDSTYTKDFNSIENSNKAGFTVGLEVVEYVEKGAVQDSVRQYWKEQSYEYLNTHLLP